MRLIRLVPLTLLLVVSVNAEVRRIVVDERVLLAGEYPFGEVGQYEKIRGTIHYEVDPENDANAAIVDLELAPKNERGKVEFSGTFMLLKPADMSEANGRLFYEVTNRGRALSFHTVNRARPTRNPKSLKECGDGFLTREGYCLLFSGWNWDVTEGQDRFQFEVPHATNDGQVIRQKIAAEIVNRDSMDALPSMPITPRNSRGYPSANYPDNTVDVLTVRDFPEGKRTVIPNDQWSYASSKDGEVHADSRSIHLKGGFLPGRIYELIYEVENPKVAGLGLAAVRDILAFFKFEKQDADGVLNPLFRDTGDAFEPAIEHSYAFGMSQSGRFITHMLMQGFHVDEKNRMVFDGAFMQVAGGGKGGFNSRFVQTTQHPLDLTGNYMPADYPPFNFLAEEDPESGGNNDVLAAAKKHGKLPKIIISNSALEYWGRSASLIHTSLDGKQDASIHDNVRIYVINGAPHGHTGTRSLEVAQHGRSTISTEPTLKSLQIMLDDWVAKDIAPAESRYPRIDRGELITPAAHKQEMPTIPSMRHPGRSFQTTICDYGPDFWDKGIMTQVPPKIVGHYPTFVPSVDEDGNGLGGIRMPDLTAPLGTYQGFNPRNPEANAPNYMTSFYGSFWPFALTKEERIERGDTRLSIEERYAGKEAYVQQVIAKVKQLQAERFLTQKDADEYIAVANAMSWPPVTQDRSPFWK